MNYIDSNVFIHAAIDDGPTGAAARRIIAAIESGRFEATTSSITFNEIVCIVRKEGDIERSLAAGKIFLASQLSLIPVDRAVLSEALEVIKHFRLSPKSAIHYATMRLKGIKTIVSNDPDFDKLKSITRKPIEKAIA